MAEIESLETAGLGRKAVCGGVFFCCGGCLGFWGNFKFGVFWGFGVQGLGSRV